MKNECHVKWKTFGTNPEKSLTLGSLHAWAKADNPYTYRDILNTRIYNRILYGSLTEVGVAEVASKILRGKYICTNAKANTWYRFDGTRWEEEDNATELKKELHTTVSEQFKKALERYRAMLIEDEKKAQAGDKSVSESCSDKSEYMSDKISDIMQKLGGRRYQENIVVLMQQYLLDTKFEERLDSNINLLAFTNGVYDLEVGRFRQATPDDYLSISVGYTYLDYIDPDLTRKVKDYWEKMHPNKDQRDYLLKTLSRQLYGDSGRELFHIHAGKGGSASNGKTTMWQLLETILGEYVRKTQVSILTAKSREEASRPQPEYAYWRGRRMLYVTEPEQAECMHSGIVKDLTGGEKITFRQLYSNKYVTFKPQFKWHMMCNDPPKLDGTDDGMKRRMRKIDFISKFVDAEEVNEEEHKYQIDHSLFKELQNSIPLRMAFLRHLLDHFDIKYAFEMPDSIRKTCECYLKDNDGVAQFVEEFIEKSSDKEAHFTLKEAKELFSKQEYYNGRIGTLKTDLEKLLKIPCLDQKKIDGKNTRYVFVGYKLKSEETNW